VAITGTEDEVIKANVKKFRKSNVTLTGGKQFVIPSLPKSNRDEALQNYTDEIMCQMAAILPERYRGVYAEHPRLKELLANN
jgi:1-acyl-sn-glycerol-3-phosphate acyltransferase